MTVRKLGIIKFDLEKAEINPKGISQQSGY